MTALYTRKTVVRVQQPDGNFGPPTWGLVGADMASCGAIGRMPEHRDLESQVTATRDGGRHRYLMKLFQTAHKALPEDWPAMSYDTFRKALMIDAGFYDEACRPGINDTYEYQRIAWSLKYAAMDDLRHKEVVAGVIKCLCQRWIPGLNSEAFTNEILEAIG